MDFMEQTQEGVVLEATFWGADLRAIRLLPYRMDPGSFAPRPVTGPRAERVLDDVWSAGSGPFSSR
jgi:poly-gamma-glutamate synthesis protein (capsule biosynthesis protein)